MPLIGSSKFIFAAQAKRGTSQRAVKPASSARLGSLPEWNLADLYGGIDDPQVKRDLDRARAKFYADVQERITAASTHLLFFVLELNRIDDAKLEAAMQEPALGHYRPWLEVACDRADPQSHAGFERSDTQGGFTGARQDIQGKPADLCVDHQRSRQGQ